MEIPPTGTRGLEVPGTLERQRSLVGRPQIPRAAEEPRNVLREHVQHLPRSFTAGDAFGGCWKDGQGSIPASRKLTMLHQIDLVCEIGILRAIGAESLDPFQTGCLAARTNTCGKVLI